MRRLRAGDEHHAIKARAFLSGARRCEVPDVDRIKGSAEDPEPHG
jgi:hypothetical protein